MSARPGFCRGVSTGSRCPERAPPPLLCELVAGRDELETGANTRWPPPILRASPERGAGFCTGPPAPNSGTARGHTASVS